MMRRLLLLVLVAGFGAFTTAPGLTGCAGGRGGRAFQDMTAAEHRQAAARERRLAMDEAAKARDALGTPPSPGGLEVPVVPWWDDFLDPSWDPLEPEHYVVEERTRVPGENHADAAKRHRENADRHEAAAERLERTARVPGRTRVE